MEGDAQESQRDEVFAPARRGDAIARLYERYADLLPDGPARVRAAATARSVAAVMNWPTDFAPFAAALDPAVEGVDHRLLAFGAAHGAENALEVMHSIFDCST